MKHVLLILLGFVCLIVAVVCPLPTMFMVPGLIWRIMIGFLAFVCFVFGVCRMRQRRK